MSDVLTMQFQEAARAPDGLTAATWKDQVKKRFPEPAEGTCREVPPELKEQLQLAQAAAAFWSGQEALIKVKIREAMGGAEIATIDGEPFMVRELIPYKGHWVRAGTRDTLKPPPKEPGK